MCSIHSVTDKYYCRKKMTNMILKIVAKKRRAKNEKPKARPRKKNGKRKGVDWIVER